MKRSLLIASMLILSAFHRAAAQSSDHESHGVSIGVLGGTWSIGSGLWPFFLMTGDVRLTPHFILGGAAGAVSRPLILCSEGIDDPMCDRTKMIRMVAATARYEFGDRRLRPYIGASAGRTWYFESGTLVALHGGLYFAATSRINLRLDAALQTIAESEGLGGATSLQAGASIRP
jgi:hypothetical protein